MRLARLWIGLALLAGLATPAIAVQPSIIVHAMTIQIDVRADGTATIIQHRRQSPTSRAAASQTGQVPLGFNPSLGTLDITEAYTRKRDGSRVDVDLSQVRTQLAPGVPSAPIFRDIQQKVVIFPDLAENDETVMTYREEQKVPLFPGHFTWIINFPRTIAFEDVELRITAPAGYPLRAEAHGPVGTQRTLDDGRTEYTWRYRQSEVIAEEVAAVSAWDRLPRLFISSFPDYAALASAYAARAMPATVVTPRVQAKADEITVGIEDRRAQARAIYQWVSARIRYVAIYLGAGGVVPHTADEVLANGYGDCKDHETLFSALLRAKGIDSHPVLINLDNAYTLSAAPTIAQLNHVITWLPEFDIYADTTTAVAPFGILPFQEYGKPAVAVGVDGDPVRTMPLLPGGLATITAVTDAHMQLDGAIFGTTRIEASGPAAVALRLSARWAQTAGHEGAARRQLSSLGQQGTGIYSFASPDGFEPRYVVDGRFKLDPLPEILEGDSFAPPLGLLMLIRPGDYLLGPLHRTTLAENEPTPCYSGRQVEELRLEVPEGRTPVRLPKERIIRHPAFTYRSTWSMAGQVITVRRELVAAFETALCSGDLRRDIARAMPEIRRDQRTKIVLNEP